MAVSGSPTSPTAISPTALAGLFLVPRSRQFSSAASKQACSSILVRPASGFLQVSLSKVLRPECSAAPRYFSPKHSRSRLTTWWDRRFRLALSPVFIRTCGAGASLLESRDQLRQERGPVRYTVDQDAFVRYMSAFA